jgi:hypothetical protein
MSNVLRVVWRFEDVILRVCDGRQRRTKHCWWARFAVRPAKSITTNLDWVWYAVALVTEFQPTIQRYRFEGPYVVNGRARNEKC